MFTPRLNNFSGVAPATLQQWLAESQQALNDLSTGAKGEAYSYTQGDGSRSVTYTRTDIGALQAHINALLYALGMKRRRAIRPVF